MSAARWLQGLAMVLTLSAGLRAQGRGGGPGGGMGDRGMGGSDRGMGGSDRGMGGVMSRGPFGGGSAPSATFPTITRPGQGSTTEGRHGDGVQLGPPGRWWDNGRFAHSLGLDPRQQQRMDDIFGENKGTLVKLYKDLQHEESQLAKAVRAKQLDEAAILQQIDRVAQARGELEKANAHMLLKIRKEMTAEQVARLDDYRSDL